MAWIFGDSFDFYATPTDAILGAWDSNANAVFMALATGATNTRFNSGQALALAPSGSAPILTKASASNDAGHHLVFAYRNANFTTVGQSFGYITLFDGATAQCTVGLTGDGKINLYSGSTNNGTPLASFVAGLSLATWYGIEVEIVISNTAGSFKVRLNGATSDSFSATGLNTRGGTANNYANKINLQASSLASGTCYFDDFLWFSTSGAAPNTWVGDVRAVQQMPTSDAQLQLTPSSGTTGFSRVNNATQDGDTTYVFSSTVGQNDLYNLPALATTPVSIVAVQTKVFMRKSDSGGRTARIQIKSGATTSNGPDTPLNTTYTYQIKTDVTDPNTSAAWSAAAVNALQVGSYVVA